MHCISFFIHRVALSDKNRWNSDFQHELCVLTTDYQLYISPAGKGSHQIHRCLNAGCGTGIWALDFGLSDGCIMDK